MKKNTLVMVAVGVAALFVVYKHNGGAPLLGKQPKKTAAPGTASVLPLSPKQAVKKTAHRAL